jgi:hypothetical protein
MFPLRDQNGCWPERERVERRIDDSMVSYFSFGIFSDLFTTCTACMYLCTWNCLRASLLLRPRMLIIAYSSQYSKHSVIRL